LNSIFNFDILILGSILSNDTIAFENTELRKIFALKEKSFRIEE